MEDFHQDNQLENPSHVSCEAALRKMEDFPEDIQSKILSGVPGESVLNCKLVCKRWQQLLSNRRASLGIYFSFSCYRPVIEHYYAGYDVIKSTKPEEEDFYGTKISKINLPPIKDEGVGHDVLVDSCNGLVCLAIPYKDCFCDPVYICNPYTSEYTILPRVSTKCWVGDVRSGFGYLPSTDEYKVVRILYPYEGYRRPASEDDKIVVQVYTLGKNSSSGWRDITAVPPGLLHREATCANGSLYWKYGIDGLVSFDLVDESFRMLPTPPCLQIPREQETVYFLKMLGGHLCLIDHEEDDLIDIWSFRKSKQQAMGSMMEQEYYRDWIWSKDFSIEREQDGRFYEPFALTKNNQVLIWSQSSIRCYEPVTKSWNVIVGRERDSAFVTFKGIQHMNSLVSLKDLGVPSKTWTGLESKKTQLSQEK